MSVNCKFFDIEIGDSVIFAMKLHIWTAALFWLFVACTFFRATMNSTFLFRNQQHIGMQFWYELIIYSASFLSRKVSPNIVWNAHNTRMKWWPLDLVIYYVLIDHMFHCEHFLCNHGNIWAESWYYDVFNYYWFIERAAIIRAIEEAKYLNTVLIAIIHQWYFYQWCS